MAKRKATKRRRTTRRVSTTRRRRRTSTGGKIFNQKTLMAAGLYGAVRAKASAMILPYTGQVFGQLGVYADEAGMLAGIYVVDKVLKPKGTMKDVLKVAAILEVAQIGQQMAGGSSGGASAAVYG